VVEVTTLGPELEEPVAVLGVDGEVVVAGDPAEVGPGAAVAPKEIEVVVFVRQLVEEPGATLKGADCIKVPVESRMSRPRLVCAGWLTSQVNEVALVSGKVIRAAAPG